MRPSPHMLDTNYIDVTAKSWLTFSPYQIVSCTYLILLVRIPPESKVSLLSVCQYNGQVQHHEITLQSCYVSYDGPGWLSRYSEMLRAGRSTDRTPVGARFSVPVPTQWHRVLFRGINLGAR